MNVFRSVTKIALALICGCLCHCTTAESSKPPKIALGFVPPGLSIESRSVVPALSAEQAKQKQMNALETAWRVQPENEVIHLGTAGAMRVIHVPSRAEVLPKDYPGFARGLSNMKDFIHSKPVAYPDPPQPDFLFANASVYVRAKFRCLDLPWGKAVIMLAQYTQEAHPPPPNSDDLRIWIRGISNDALQSREGFCISGELKVTHPQLKSRDAACTEVEGQDEEKAIADGEKRLNAFPDESFSPSLKDIERMLQELKAVEAP